MKKVSRKFRKNILYIIYSILFATIFININNSYAETFDANVTIKPSLTLDISSDKISMSLDPASKTYDEKDLTVSIGTNNSYGYKLYLTTNGTDLVNIADSTKTIPTLPSTTPAAGYDINSMPANYWGYRLTQNSTISSGNYLPFPSSATTATTTTSSFIVSESDTPINNNVSTLGFASKIDYTMPSGTYELTLNFKALPIVTQYYMQDLSDSTLASKVCTEDPTIVIDKRDEQAYTIRRINGTCWMIDNLRFTGTELDYTTSNVANSYTPDNPYQVNSGSGYYDLIKEGTSGGKCYGAFSTGFVGTGDGFIYSCTHKDSNNYTNGDTVWYNYAAATAGSIAGLSNPNIPSYDVCPAGWRLFSNSEMDSVIGHETEFNPIYGGIYANAVHDWESFRGHWWSATAITASNPETLRNDLSYDNGSLRLSGHIRYFGLYVRCVLK